MTTVTSEQPAATRGKLWDPDAETMPRSELVSMQNEKLQRQLRYIYRNSRFFQDLWDAAGVHPRRIESIDELHKLPTFNKDDLRTYREKSGDPFAGTCCVPADQLALVAHSTGTSGKPNLYGLTAEEYEEVGKIYARSSYTIGLRPGYHLIMIGGTRWHGAVLGWDKAFDQMGIVKYYFGNGTHDIVKELIDHGDDLRDLDAVMVYQPEAELQYLRSAGVDPKKIFPNLKMLWSAVDASPARRKILVDTWGVPFKNQYGSGDQFWMTGECPHDYRDHHAPEDYFLFEALDPTTNEPVPAGHTGVLHVTNLWATSFPYIRYNMEDMVTCSTAPCACGRTSMRLRVHGRLAWSVRIGDRYVFTQEVENVLWEQPGMAGANYQLVRQSPQPQHRLIVRVVPNAAATSPALLREQLEEALTREFGVPSDVVFVDPGDITTKGVKMQRIHDDS
ncbi:hypothetical protein A9W98_16930 [Mycobacterium gordonae]|jgi:phenylacetate-CoA ligase|uniref:AMP-dependent ligase C-terminal domain-containing protein n=1 Tax=Mycobacterium gordonae TaxID=1778 RepID=A0A1A6BIB0_MYCGO|nr:phenylacetate--CoA ligase family protein [Mycobacterium gordonae]MBI2703506.1 phenylacetate--CoA ligase family protein [Mycobacterium sp.]OBS02060.1 hypothetical protein A9W98_16930 [Mycobacterium gordonae]